jgi:hypothetical protein
VKFGVGVEIISSYMPNTVVLASGIDGIRSNTVIREERTKNIIRFKCRNDKKAAFLGSLINIMSLGK